MTKGKRNRFLLAGILIIALITFFYIKGKNDIRIVHKRSFNDTYTGPYLNRIAFPLGGIGAGMVCVEGNGSISHVSLRHKPDIHNQPFMFGAISVKGLQNGTKVLEGPVQDWKIFGNHYTGNGGEDKSYGFPRFEKSAFTARFPFCSVSLEDDDIPLDVIVNCWSPFIPIDEDNSSLPVAGLEYSFTNTSGKELEATFSYNSINFMAVHKSGLDWKPDKPTSTVLPTDNGFILWQGKTLNQEQGKSIADRQNDIASEGSFAIFTDENNTTVDHCWFRGGWFDSRTRLWDDISSGNSILRPTEDNSTGASLYVPFKLLPGETKTIKVMFAWYVPHSTLRIGSDPSDEKMVENTTLTKEDYENDSDIFYEPWYAEKFNTFNDLISYWRNNYNDLRSKSALFSETFFSSDLPPEVIEAVAANLSILKSPTILRQKDGRLWGWEGCFDDNGSCHGSCTHVWNYAQSISHLFPYLERTLRETEFIYNQNEDGHQAFRANLPIRPNTHDFYAAADGQLGGIMKAYREWRISGNTGWLKKLWPRIKNSFNYCNKTWDCQNRGVLEEPHHNTYDIEFHGPDGMCTSIYLGAIKAMIEMGTVMNDDVSLYRELLKNGSRYMEAELFNGEYFIQKIQLDAIKKISSDEEKNSRLNYSPEALKILETEGPKYQYGNGCLSDGIIGCWISEMCGLGEFLNHNKVRSHLVSVYRYNLKKDLSDHVNPQRPTYACAKDGGLLLCTWPKGDKLSLPFVYSNEVWTGIEYQVASHLMLNGEVEKGLEIVRQVRERYDGRVRNPFDEYECGHWYARAMSSYGLIQGLTGIFYDAVDKILYIDSKIGNNFKSFFSGETGYGLVGLNKGKPFIKMISGEIKINRCYVSGKLMDVNIIKGIK